MEDREELYSRAPISFRREFAYTGCATLSLSLPPRACAVLHSSKHTIARGRASFSGSFHSREEGGDFLALSSGDCGDILVNARSVWVGSDVLISVFGVC